MLYGKDQIGKRGSSLPYPDLFYDLTSFVIPRDIKKLLKWCRYFYNTNPIVSGAIYKMAEYPLTEIYFKNVSETYAKQYKEIADNINLETRLLEIGLDYYTYGNAFVTPIMPFKRVLKCSRNPDHVIDAVNAKQLSVNGGKIEAFCPQCKAKVKMTYEDIPIKDPSKMKIIQWNPMSMEIGGSSIVDDVWYYYTPSQNELKNVSRDPDYFARVPNVFIETALKKKRVRLYQQKVIHMKRATISNEFWGWGMPIVLPVLKTLFYVQMLKKAQEYVAANNMNIMRVFYPSSSNGVSPYETLNLDKWKQQMKDDTRRWMTDPGYMVTSGIPIGYQAVGGEGKSLLLTDEIEGANQEILAGMGVPHEFLFGGLTWTGTSVSLRMLENHFLVYRNTMIKFLNKLFKQIALHLGWPIPEVGMRTFKVADDVQQKQMIMNLATQPNSRISATTVLQELGLDPKKEADNIKAETKLYKEALKDRNALFAEMQADSQIVGQQQMNETNVRMPNIDGKPLSVEDIKMLASGEYRQAMENYQRQMQMEAEQASQQPQIAKDDLQDSPTPKPDTRPAPEQKPPRRQ